MRPKYFSRVGSLAMKSFSIYHATMLESVQRIHFWTPMALNLRSSLAMKSFFIYPATMLESVQRIHLWTPMALNLRSPDSMASYSTMLLVHLSDLMLNCILAA
jgi:hypothetical protein